jgi:hypothetical protein
MQYLRNLITILLGFILISKIHDLFFSKEMEIGFYPISYLHSLIDVIYGFAQIKEVHFFVKEGYIILLSF